MVHSHNVVLIYSITVALLYLSVLKYVSVCMWQALALVRDSPLLSKLANSALYPLIYVVQQFLHWLFMGYPLVPFCLFTYDKWLKVRQILILLFYF